MPIQDASGNNTHFGNFLSGLSGQPLQKPWYNLPQGPGIPGNQTGTDMHPLLAGFLKGLGGGMSQSTYSNQNSGGGGQFGSF